ncbi:GIP, partial [Symbiodinium necroappetens]
MSQPGSAEAADEDDAEEEPAHMSDFLADDDDNDEQHPSYLDDGAGEPDEEEELLRDPAPGGSMARGRQGPRSSPSSAGSESSRKNKAVAPAGTEKSKERAQRRPRGNLPQAPSFDGDRRKDPKCFRKYATKVDSYVEIAKNIIDDAEIGLRLHAALDGEAADYLEDVPAKVFGVDNGWQVLLKLLRDKFDEKRMHKVGSAMKGFFKMNLSDKAYTMSEVVDLMDRAARRCRESNLTIPDEVMVFFFFEHTAMSTERQANLLLRTGGEYNWKKMKQAVELLYQNVTVKAGRDRDANQGGFRGRQRAAHETHNTNEWNADLWRIPEPHASEEQIGNWLYDHDPVEALAEVEMTEIPESMARELHACFASHRENRQRLARAVQARGYYVGGGKGKSKSADKGKGKSSDKGKGKSKKGGGKARGMSLEELKARTACGDCGQKGHWRGDPECRGPKKANEANRAPDDGAEDEEEADDWYGEYDDGSWSQWEAQRYGYPVRRSTFETRAPTQPAMSSTPSATRSSDFLAHESEAVARGINRVRKKAGIPQDVEAADVRKALAQDSDPKVTDIRENVIDQQRAVMAESPSAEAVAKAFEHFGLDVVPHSRKGVLELLQDPDDELPDIEALRKVMAVRRVPWSMVLCPKSVPRGVQSAMRRPPTVEEGRCYLTLDTACENSVSGTTILQSIAGRLQQQFAVKPIIRPESETYCFGPGEPTMSQERWMVPIGIRGRPCVIATSSIPDQNGSKIPFLAGQDWMVFMNACLDIGRHIAIFREIGVQAPLYVDITGHLVIAIDEMPSSGWPQDLVARKDAYPGVLFEQSGRNAGATGKASGMAKHFAPTHVYEPNDASEGRPCTVAADHWEFQVDRQIYVRHHCRPRTLLFAPGDTLDGPDPKDLQPVRITWKAGAEEPVCDDWVNGVEEVSVPWVGATYFLGKGIDMSHVQFAPVSVDVPVQFADGSVQHVKPHELNCVNPKKVHHFDLKTTKPPEAPQPLRKGRFHIPAGEFGSKAWGRMVDGLLALIDLVARHVMMNMVVRNVKHKMPALASYTEALYAKDILPETLPATGPPATTNPKGQVRKVVTGPYPQGILWNVRGDTAMRPGASWSASSAGQCGPACCTRCPTRRRRFRCTRTSTAIGPLRAGPSELLEAAVFASKRPPQKACPNAIRALAARISSGAPLPSTATSSESGKPTSKGGRDPPTDDEETVNLRDLAPEERERLKTMAAQRLEDKRRQAAVDRKRQEATYHTGRQDEVKVTFEAEQDSWEAVTVSSEDPDADMPSRRGSMGAGGPAHGSTMTLLRSSVAPAKYHCGRPTIGNLKVLQPIDSRYGIDLRRPEQRRWLKGALAEHRPRLVVIGFPCTPWKALQTTQAQRQALLEDDKIFQELVCELFREQRSRGGHVIAEYQKDLAINFDSECYVTPRPLRVRDYARGRDCADGDAGGDPLEVFPPALGDAVCRSYLDLVATEDYGFASTWATSSERAVHYVDVKREEDAWRPLLQQAEELLGRKVQASLLVHPDTDLYRKVQALVPWQLALVQVAHLPKAKRVKAGLEECHRASVLLLNDDTIVIETEYLKEAQAPRERFVTPVRYAIFVLGYAPGVQEGLVQEGLVRQDFAGECWFIGGPLREKEKALARALVRMHRNLGHPRMEDMIRALAQSNKVDPEAVCLDFVHIADAEKVTHRFLHILEPNGSFNLYYPSKTRQPEDVLSIFCDVWSSWAGFPDYIHCDQDGAFEGAFLDKMRHMGVEVEMVPAEAHWQAGQVEAYNRAFRYAAEKAVDEFQLVGELDMKILGAMVSASLNEKVKTCGCSANQWVFGKDPKMPWDLLSPDGRIEALQGLDADYEIRRRQQVRAASDQKIA